DKLLGVGIGLRVLPVNGSVGGRPDRTGRLRGAEIARGEDRRRCVGHRTPWALRLPADGGARGSRGGFGRVSDSGSTDRGDSFACGEANGGGARGGGCCSGVGGNG